MQVKYLLSILLQLFNFKIFQLSNLDSKEVLIKLKISDDRFVMFQQFPVIVTDFIIAPRDNIYEIMLCA